MRITPPGVWWEGTKRQEQLVALRQNIRFRKASGEDYEYEVRDEARLEEAIRKLGGEIEQTMRGHLEAGRLIAQGRLGRLDTEPTRIPADIWPGLKLIDYKTSAVGEARKGGTVYLAVRTIPPVLADEAAELIHGRALVEVFRKFVLEDPEVMALAGDAIRIAPGYGRLFLEGRWTPHGVSEWPVNAGRSRPFGPEDYGPIGFLAEPLPRAVVAATNALLDRFGALVDLLRTGRLVASGLPAERNFPGSVPRGVWSHPSLWLNLQTGDLLETNPDAVDPPRDLHLKRWTALALECTPPGKPGAPRAERLSTSERLRPRARPKSDAVEAALRAAGIDLTGSTLRDKEIASRIAGALPFRTTTEAEMNALAKLIGRLRQRDQHSP